MPISKLIAISVLSMSLWGIGQPCGASQVDSRKYSVSVISSGINSKNDTNHTSPSDDTYWKNHLDVVLGDVENDKIYRRFAKGQCTWYAWGRFKEVHHKSLRFKAKLDIDAKLWPTLITNCKITHKPSAKAIAVSTQGPLGHLIFIEYIHGNTVYYTDANGDGNNHYDRGEDCKLKKTTLDSEFMKGFTKFMSR